MRHLSTLILGAGTLVALGSYTADASAQAGGYCPVYADNNWRLSWVEEALGAWTKDQRGSTSFDAHLKFCKDVFRDEPDAAPQILFDEWEARYARIADRLTASKAIDMVGYLQDWPNRMSYICDNYADFNTALSEMGQHLGADIGSLVESEHRDYCVDTIYQNDDQGAEVQQAWADRYETVVQLLAEHAAR
jgi:hypothetical protein